MALKGKIDVVNSAPKLSSRSLLHMYQKPTYKDIAKSSVFFDAQEKEKPQFALNFQKASESESQAINKLGQSEEQPLDYLESARSMSHRRLLEWKSKAPSGPMITQGAATVVKKQFSEDVFLKSRSVLSKAVLKIPQFLFNPVSGNSTDYLGIFNSRMTDDGKFYLKKAESSQSTDQDSAKLLETKLPAGEEEPEELKKKVSLSQLNFSRQAL